MKKKRVVMAIVMVLVLSMGLFAGCGNSGEAQTPSTEDDSAATAQESTEAESTAATETEATEEAAVSGDDVYTVGLSLPSQALQAWNLVAESYQTLCDAAGLELVITYADDNPSKQLSDLENLISQGIDVLAVLPVDETTLGPAVQQAHDQGIWVIAYERPLQNTEYVDYYVNSADLIQVGLMQGNFFVEHFNLDEDDGKTYTIELFAGEPSTSGAREFFDGSMQALQPYFDSGKLVCKSGQTDFLSVAIEAYSMEGAQNRMDNLLTAYYSDGVPPDMILSPNDSEALGIVNALQNAGYTDPENFPAITGQDCDLSNMKLMFEGYIAQNIFKNRYVLVENTIQAIEAHRAGEDPVVHGVTNNGVIDVPTFYGPFEEVRPDNWYQTLVEGEGAVYTLEDLGLTEADIPQ